MVRSCLLSSCLILIWVTAFGQDTLMHTVPDTAFANYQASGHLGGPRSAQVQLQINNSRYQPNYRIKNNQIDQWFEWKSDLEKKTGIQFGISYSALILSSSHFIEPNSKEIASSGAFELTGVWNFLNRNSKNTGSLNLVLDARHAYGGSIDPAFLHEETGSGMSVAMEFFSSPFRALELFWQQSILNDRMEFVIGKVDPFNYFTIYPLMNGFAHFLNIGFSVSPVAAWPSSGMGFVGKIKLFESRNLYLKYGINDALGDKLIKGDLFDLGDQFFDGNYMHNLEMVWVKSPDDRLTRQVSLSYWVVDEIVRKEGNNEVLSSFHRGMSLNVSWLFAQKIQTFYAIGLANGGGLNSAADRSFALGGSYFFHNRDVLGLGVNWIEPIEFDRKQLTMECYYRFQPSPVFSITPSIQWVYQPVLDQTVNSIFYFGLRGRFTL